MTRIDSFKMGKEEIMQEQAIEEQAKAQIEATQRLDPYIGNSIIELNKYMVDPAARHTHPEVNKDLNTSYVTKRKDLDRLNEAWLLYEALEQHNLKAAARLIYTVDVQGRLQLFRSWKGFQSQINVTNIKQHRLVTEEQKKRGIWGLKNEEED